MNREIVTLFCLTICLLMVVPVYGEDNAFSFKSVMTPSEFSASGLTKLTPQELEILDRWLRDYTLRILEIVQNRANPSSPTIGEIPWEQFGTLEGAIVISEDGTVLGVITTNRFKSDSIFNEFRSTSIKNKFGKYGSEYSSYSPFNRYTSTPPRIFKQDRFIGYLTVNEYKTPRVDPHLLIAWYMANSQ